MRFNWLLAGLCAGSLAAAELAPTNYFTPECLAEMPQAEFRSDVERVLKRAESVLPAAERLAAELKAAGSPRLNAMQKRLEITTSLVNYVSARLTAGTPEMLLYAWSAHDELAKLLNYFEGEAKLAKEQKSLPAPKLFSVKEFGAKGDGRGDDGPAIRRTIEAALATKRPARITLPAGTYRIEPEKNPPAELRYLNRETGRLTSYEAASLKLAHLVFNSPEHLTFEGEAGTKLLFTDPTQCGLRLLGGYAVTMRNLTLDYETLPYTQGRIAKAAADGSSVELEIDPGFPAPNLPNFLQAPSRRITPITPHTRTYLPGTYPLGKVEPLGGNRYRVEVGKFRASEERRNLEAGNLAVITGRYDTRLANAICSFLSKFDRYENINIHSSASWTILLQSEAPELRNCRVAPPEGSSRLASSNGDGLMYFALRVGPYLEGCTFSSMEDDGLNVAASSQAIDRVPEGGKTLEPEWLMHRNSGVLIIDGNTGQIKAAAKVVMKDGKYEFSPPLPAGRIKTRDSLKQRQLTNDEEREKRTMYRDDEVPLPDRCIGQLKTFGGTAVVNCTYRNIRGLGIQVTAPSVWVEGCTFDALTGAGVDMTALTAWGMYYSTHNSRVSGCTIRNTQGHAIRLQVVPPYAKGTMEPRSLTGIVIENNDLESVGAPTLRLENCSGVEVRNNRVSGKRAAVTLKNFADVIFENNTFTVPAGTPAIVFADPAEKSKLTEK